MDDLSRERYAATRTDLTREFLGLDRDDPPIDVAGLIPPPPPDGDWAHEPWTQRTARAKALQDDRALSDAIRRWDDGRAAS